MQAANGNRLNSRTYQRLNLALLLWSATPLLNSLYQLDAFTAPYLPVFYAALGLPTLAVAVAALRSSVAPEEDLVQSSLEDFKNGINLLGKKTSLGQYLSFNFILNFLVGGSFACSPRTPLPLPRRKPSLLRPSVPAILMVHMLSCCSDGSLLSSPRPPPFLSAFLHPHPPVLFVLISWLDRGDSRHPPGEDRLWRTAAGCAERNYLCAHRWHRAGSSRGLHLSELEHCLGARGGDHQPHDRAGMSAAKGQNRLRQSV